MMKAGEQRGRIATDATQIAASIPSGIHLRAPRFALLSGIASVARSAAFRCQFESLDLKVTE